MQIKIKELTLTNIFELSQFIKDTHKGLLSLEEVAQEIMKTFCRVFVTDSGKSMFALSRFFKSCIYKDLPEDIKRYIQHKEDKEEIPAKNKYLTLLGTWGDMEEWRCRRKSKEHQALPLHDPDTVYNIPMLSALLSQIGFKITEIVKTDKIIITDEEEHEFGVFCVENARDDKHIPAQGEFVEPFGIESVFGFGGSYSTGQIYAIIMFCREKISKETVKLFASLNPAVKLITLRHEITGNIFKLEDSV